MVTYNPYSAWKGADPKVIAGFMRAVKETKASDKVRLALFSAGIVEDNLHNSPKMRDLDSVGSLQQRAGWGSFEARMDPFRAAKAFIHDAQNRVLPRNPGISAGKLAQAVQRSAYPTRYTLAGPAARYVIRKALGLPDEVHNPGSRVLRLGVFGEDVKFVQKIVKVGQDGDFGAVTEKAVKAYQKKHLLFVDGIVGPVTWAKMGVK